jgi:hypothetical protein
VSRLAGCRKEELTRSANAFANQAQWTEGGFGWFSATSKTKEVRLLGPSSLIKELDDDLWCTMVLLPQSISLATVRCDIFAKEDHSVAAKTVEKWKWMLQQELTGLSRQEAGTGDFAYQCGGELQPFRR